MAGLQFDLPAFINLVLSGLIGVAATWIVAHIYWKRNADSDRRLRELKTLIDDYFNPLLYPQFYTLDAIEVAPTNGSHEDPDVPRVTKCRFSKGRIRAGDPVEVLIKVGDAGLNLMNPQGVAVRDPAGDELPVKRCGPGFASFMFVAQLIPERSDYYISVTLCDSAKNENTQSLPFTITNPDGEPQ